MWAGMSEQSSSSVTATEDIGSRSCSTTLFSEYTVPCGQQIENGLSSKLVSINRRGKLTKVDFHPPVCGRPYPETTPLAEAQALTKWMACLPARLSWERRTVPSASLRTGLPSMATTSPGSRSATARLQSMKHSETLLEAVRVQAGEHVAESVVGGYSVGQVEEGAEPFLLAFAEHLHVDPRVGTADDGADGYGDDVQQLVPLAPVNPWILHASKTLHDPAAPPLLHHSLHPPTEPRSLTQPNPAKSIIHNAIALPVKGSQSVVAPRLGQ